MARNREGLILLLDVGPSMHNVLPEVEKLCSMLIQKKLIYRKFDEVGIVIFGTEDTDNELTMEVGGYEHVVVLRNIKVVDGDTVESLQKLPRGTVSGDYLDAIVVGMDMMIKKYQSTNKGKKHICLITDARNPIKGPYEGTKEDQVITIAVQMAAHGVRMKTIVVRGRLSEDADRRIVDENDRLLHLFSEKTSAKTVYVENSTSLLGALKTRNISPVTIFRGDLEISPKLKIKVWVYKKTSEEKFPSLKKYSDKAPPTDKYATHEVKVDYEYKSVEDPGKVVPPHQRIKGYRYGPQVVPISSVEWDAFKFKPEKGVKLLCFTDASNILRHYYIKDVNIFIAEPSNVRATIAVSALGRAMKELNKVAIVRCVWRQGQGNVVLGVLTPNLSENDKIPDSFFFNVLPFAEDVREFQFPSFSSYPASLQPSEQQQKAADNLVMMLDLAPPGKEEALLPDFTPNPILERFYHYLELKSKQPDAAVPSLDRTLKRITEPDPQLFSESKSVIESFCQSFEVKKNPKLKKSTRRFLREKPSGSDDEGGYGDASNALAIKSDEIKLLVKVDKIGDSTPIQDFEAMMSRRDSPDWVAKAIKDMENKICNIVENCRGGDNFHKALECLVALRKGCILEQEPKQFNEFLHHLFRLSQEKNLGSFWEFLASKDITLISKSEAIDSEVTDDEARKFLVKREPKLE
ncbi:ATP-dependent DNA helicase 2 subunit KU80 isoform X2 [Manihot esculenta]|uniref:ATP-dependent DNA helicase 2 subunit KU80 n=1 Tax=Manihot esculenta TaxID=3983 RepID=A0A2C9WPA7_MANES|nr:ATP-dependent DNA helicase 2 subunit KU80 isoform X2 [Manihot esculenta]